MIKFLFNLIFKYDVKSNKIVDFIRCSITCEP